MESFVLLMILHPEAMRRAQEQIDTIVGSDRRPTFADYEDLPYIRALMQEVLRYRPPLPLGKLAGGW